MELRQHNTDTLIIMGIKNKHDYDVWIFAWSNDKNIFFYTKNDANKEYSISLDNVEIFNNFDDMISFGKSFGFKKEQLDEFFLYFDIINNDDINDDDLYYFHNI